MGSENLFNRSRKPKSNQELGRKPASKKTLAKLLIVCEGLKTEPTYFEELITHFELLTASVIDVTGDCGSSPMCVVRKAKELQTEKIEQGASYDEIYIVIDKDAHVDYNNALDSIQRAKPSKTWIAINSVPCFEFWLLLHYTYTTKAYKNLPGNSSGNQVLKDLKKHIKKYEKGDKGIFKTTFNALDSKDLNEVIVKAKQCERAATSSGTDNPLTMVYKLVERLLELHALKIANRR
ncbi:RloB domain-containing protein [Citrobacter braakii]|uniref:RloB family protein n=1 Tax=Citrobacter braakii TaxID=57706 RepID=UPI001C967041|nr:RloB family protein [Citrobacter braakii]MBY5200988.1 RloB domain-containing protein [Citrobacter braakii]